MQILFFLVTFDPIFEDLKILEFSSFAIPINKKMIPTYPQKTIDFGQFSALKYVLTKKTVFLVYDKIKQDFKKFKKKKRHKFGKLKTF